MELAEPVRKSGKRWHLADWDYVPMGSAFIISMVHRRIPVLLLLLEKWNNIETLLDPYSHFIDFIVCRQPVLHSQKSFLTVYLWTLWTNRNNSWLLCCWKNILKVLPWSFLPMECHLKLRDKWVPCYFLKSGQKWQVEFSPAEITHDYIFAEWLMILPALFY